MTVAREPTLDEIGRQIRDALAQPTLAQRRLLAQLDQQAVRLRDSVFQLAVLGQFKRGKSTLLNALLGETLLSTGVLPLTAVPTFLSRSPTLSLRLGYESGADEDRPVSSIEAMAREVAAATTEEQNPRNGKGLQRVDVGVPGTPWLDEVTLIDTPGIGSTHAHNTDMAYAVLPECDAALFVCSVDPPITEVELAYLSHIRRTVPRIIVILNKVDLIDSGDLRKATAFLSAVIADRTEAEIDRRVFPVSARQALTARRAGDQAAFEASGLAELERYVQTDLIGQKRDVLERSISNKMTEIAGALAGDAAMAASALSLPLAELEATVRAFGEAASAFERERINLEDGLNGEWRRALTRLSALCEELEQRARQELSLHLDRPSVSDLPDDGRAAAARLMNDLFDKEFAALVATVEGELSASIKIHQQHYQMLAARVRGHAGALLNVAVPTALPTEWFQTKRQSYWVGELRVDSISSLTADGLARLLPSTLSRRRQQKKFREAVDKAVTRNISDLHWTMRQNIDDSFRGLIAASRDVVDASIASTQELLATARQRRQEHDVPLQDQLAQARTAERRLADLHAVLARRRARRQQ